MTVDGERLDGFERRLRQLEAELAELRRQSAPEPVRPLGAPGPDPRQAPSPVTVSEAPPAATIWPPPPGQAPTAPSAPTIWPPPPGQVPTAPSAARSTAPPAAPSTAAPTVPPPTLPPRPARPPREPFDLSKLLGARTLAMTGGVVSLLGIVFFFALAMQRGWIGPVARVSLGTAASALAVAAGWWLRRRFGETYASIAAAGVGIAGAYATLLAADARYDLVSDPAALALAVVIAVVATATALAWSDEALAGIGLVGAILAPFAVAVRHDHLRTTGVAFAALMLAAAIAVALARRWNVLLVVAGLCAGSQIVLIVLDADGRVGRVLAVAIVFWLLYVGTGIFEALRDERLTRLSGSFVLVGSAFSGYAAAALFDDRALGIALLASAAANGAVAAAVFSRARDLGSLLWATGLALAAIGTAQLLSGATLSMAWAAETVVLAWLAERLREPRFRLAALGWLILALGHVLAVDSPLERLFDQNEHPAAGGPSLLALVLAAALTAWFPAEFDEEPGGFVAELLNELRAARSYVRLALVVLAGLLAIDAASLGLLGIFSSWDWGHVAVAGLWGAIALGLMLAGQRVPGVVWATATVTLAVGYDLVELTGDARWCGVAVAAATALVVALLFERELGPVSWTGTLAGAALAGVASLGIAGHDLQWLLVLAVGVAYAALGVAFLRARRDQSTLLWGVGLVLAVAATLELLDHFWLVLALAGAAAAIAYLGRFEERLDPAALALLGLALAATLATEATPSDLFVAHRHPGAGVPAALLVVGAAAVYAWLRSLQRPVVVWTAAVLAVYAASLAILELAEALGGSVHTSFQRGHTGVSALWGLIGLSLLYTGLTRRVPAFQLGGFGLFGISLVKLFVYDLAFLSSIARALSFLAVGAVLIAGGFFYQRLAAGNEEPPPVG